MPDYFFSPELQQGRTVEISGPQRGAAVPQGPGRERPGNRKRSHNSGEVSSQDFSLAHTRYDDGKVRNFSSFFPKFNELTLLLPATQPSGICLSETWLTPSVSEPKLPLMATPFFEVTAQCPDAEVGMLYM